MALADAPDDRVPELELVAVTLGVAPGEREAVGYALVLAEAPVVSEGVVFAVLLADAPGETVPELELVAVSLADAPADREAVG